MKLNTKTIYVGFAFLLICMFWQVMTMSLPKCSSIVLFEPNSIRLSYGGRQYFAIILYRFLAYCLIARKRKCEELHTFDWNHLRIASNCHRFDFR